MRYIDIAVTLMACGVAACTATPWWEETLDSWNGAPQREVLATWGPPDLESVEPDGRVVMVYQSAAEVDERALESYELSRAADPSSPAQTPPPEFNCKTYFELLDGVVKRVYARGSGCEPKPRPAD